LLSQVTINESLLDKNQNILLHFQTLHDNLPRCINLLEEEEFALHDSNYHTE